MTGYRKGIGATVHTHRECRPIAERAGLREVELVREFDSNRLMLFDGLGMPVTVHECGNCARRDRA